MGFVAGLEIYSEWTIRGVTFEGAREVSAEAKNGKAK